MAETESPQQHVDDLIAILREDVYWDLPVDTNVRALYLLGRFTRASQDPKVAEKVLRFLETFLSNFNLLKVLKCALSEPTLEWMLDRELVLNKELTFGQRTFTRSHGQRVTNKLNGQTFTLWDVAPLAKFYKLYFRIVVPEWPNQFEVLVVLLRTLGTLAKQFMEPAVLEMVFKFCPTYRMPSFELVLEDESLQTLTNWLDLVEFSVQMGMSVCQRPSDPKQQSQFEACLEETTRHTLSHTRKCTSVCDILGEIIQSRADVGNLTALLERLKSLANKFLCWSVSLYQAAFPISQGCQTTLSDSFLFMIDNFVEHSEPSQLVELVKTITKGLPYHGKPTRRKTKRKVHPDASSCPSRLAFGLFAKVVENLRRDPDIWPTLLDIFATIPPGFCQCIDQTAFLKLITIPVTQVSHLNRLAYVVGRHAEQARSDGSGELSQVWLLFEGWLAQKDVGVASAVLRVFHSLAPLMSDDDFRRSCRVILQASVAADRPVLKANVHNEMMAVFASQLRPGLAITDVIDTVISADIEECIGDLRLQDGFFELLHVVLVCSDEVQFSRCFDLIITKFDPILKTALADVWVLLADSADNFYHAIRRLLTLFKHCLCVANTKDFYVNCSTRLDLELQALAKSCADVLQNCQTTSKELSKAAQLLSLLSFVLFLKGKKSADLLSDSLKKVLDQSSFSVNLLLLHFLARDSYLSQVHRFTTSNPESHEVDSDDEITSTSATRRIDPSLSLSLDQMFDFFVRATRNLLSKVSEWTAQLEFQVIHLMKAVREEDSAKRNKATELLFDIIDDMSQKGASSHALNTLMLEVTKYIDMEPKTKHLAKLLTYIYSGSEMAKTAFECVSSLLVKHKLQPSSTLVFPQPLTVEDTPPLDKRVHQSAAYLHLDPVHRISASDGLTLSFWISADRASPGRYHVMSFGSVKLVVTLELNLVRNSATVKIMYNNQVVENVKFRKMFPNPNHWLNCTIGFVCNENQIKASVLLGSHLRQISNVNKDFVPDSDPFFVSIGAVSPTGTEPSPAFRIGNVYCFKGVLSADCALLLRALGCDQGALTCCALGQNLFSFLTCATNALIHAKADFHKVFLEPKLFLDKLQRSLLFTIYTERPRTYGLSVLQRGMEMEKINSGQTLYLTVSQEISLMWRCQPVTIASNKLDTALSTLGHVKLLLFGYSLTVDRAYGCETQAAALWSLMLSLRRDPRAHVKFVELDGYSILVRTLMSKEAFLDQQIFFILCNFIFSKVNISSNGPTVSPHTVILEPKLLCELVSHVALWKGCAFPFWISLLRLTHHATCHSDFSKKLRTFNLGQLSSVKFLSELLRALLDMMTDLDNFEWAPTEFPDVLCTLVCQLLESPTSCRQVSALWDFIQLSHPAPDTYIDKNIRPLNDWIDYELLSHVEPSVLTASDLAEHLNQLITRHCKDDIEGLWASTNSLLEIRKTFVDPPTIPDQVLISSKLNGLYLPDDVGTLTPTSQLSKVHYRETNPAVEHWLVHMRSLILNVVSDLLVTCQDTLMACLELDVLNWPAIMVLFTNQRFSKIRTKIFVLLKNFLIRCDKKFRKSLVEHNGFAFLANEVMKSHVNEAIVDSLFSITFTEHIVVESGIDLKHMENLHYDRFRIASFRPLFACLEQSVDDANTFWSVCSTLRKMFEGSATARAALLDQGLGPCLINVLKRMDNTRTEESLHGPVFPVLDCWINFVRVVFNSVIPYRVKRNVQHCEELVWLCFAAEAQQCQASLRDSETPAGLASRRSITMRRMMSVMLIVWLDSIKDVLADPLNSFKLTGDGHGSDASSDFEILGSESEFSSFNDHARHSLLSSRSVPNTPAQLEVLAQRMCFALRMAAHMFIFMPPPEEVIDEEDALFQRLLAILFNENVRAGRDEFSRCLMLCREECRALLADILAFVLFDVQTKLAKSFRAEGFDVHFHERFQLEKRWKLMEMLDQELQHNRAFVSGLLDLNLDYQYALKIAVLELGLLPQLTTHLNSDDIYPQIDRFLKLLRSIQVDSPLSNLSDAEILSICTDEALLVQSFKEKSVKFYAELLSRVQAIKLKEQAFLDNMGDVSVLSNYLSLQKANNLTCELAQLHGIPRKALLQWRKQQSSTLAKSLETLTALVRELCHPGACFHDKASWPRGWALDPTENWRRERRRLKPAHYQFSSRFLRKSRQQQIGQSGESPAPLDRLLEGHLGRSTVERVEAHSQVRLSVGATLIRTVFECQGELVVSDKKLYFLGEVAKTTQKGKQYEPVNHAWTFEQIREIQSRFYLLKDNALELFTTTGDAFLLVFQTVEERSLLLNQLHSMNLSSLIVDPVVQLTSATKMWRNGLITNFDYLIILNKLAGRSFNDLMQYPVFPFILSDYTSSLLDLNSPYSFRELSRPMAIQDRKMEQVYTQSYQALNDEYHRNAQDPMFPSAHFGAYHYGSHYSNTGIVAHYLVRVLPYTMVALEYQDNNFDIPDRLFNTLETTWRLSSSESTTDFKELIPEFFFFPEMFQNREGLELGIRQAGQQVDHVLLPPWCPRGNARLFCLIHRQGLESAHVTQSLHAWIDLIFGYKQNGEQAVKAVNVFHPATYRGRALENESAGDEVYLSAVRTMVRTYGQMPVQLFVSPHLRHLEGRSPATSVENQLLPSVRGLRWGDFVGNPETDDRLCAAPSCIFKLEAYERIHHLAALHLDGTSVCYGLPAQTSLIAKYKSDKSDALRRNFELSLTAVLSWRFSDNILRIKPVQLDDSVWVNLIDLHGMEVTQLVYSPSNDLMYIGFSTGLIRVYSLVYNTNTKLWRCSQKGELLAHKESISSLSICDNFHVLLSTGADCHICFWDTNRLEFVRELDPHSRRRELCEEAHLSCISHINADVAVVFRAAIGTSRVNLYTVNGDLVGEHHEEMAVQSLAMTNLDEGLGVNCLALGLQSGMIRLLEMWTLTTVRIISCQNFHSPVINLQFTSDSRRIYAALANSHVLCWQAASLSKSRAPAFKMLNPFI